MTLAGRGQEHNSPEVARWLGITQRPSNASRAWERCRDGFMQSKGYVCELCGDWRLYAHQKNTNTRGIL